MAPLTAEGCSDAGVDESSPPMVRKLSNANSGNRPKKARLMPLAFQDELYSLLYQDPVEDSMTMGLLSSPEHEDK